MRNKVILVYAADELITGPAWDARRQVETLRFLVRREVLA